MRHANSFVRELFFQRLPSDVYMVLASMNTSMDTNKLDDMADKVMEVATPTTAAITDTNLDRAENGEVKKLRDEVTRLSDLVASLST